jgi:hypothetical protein
MRFWVSGSVVAVVACAVALAQTPKAASKKAAAHRANELTLAGIRPGQDSIGRAVKLLGDYAQVDPEAAKGLADRGGLVWVDNCQKLLLTIDVDTGKRTQIIGVKRASWLPGDCGVLKPSRWRTGRGLRLGDDAKKMTELYGEPDSKSPSSKGDQQLELWYYAFDWAGPDVPQVMEVLCTVGQDGKPGRVVEITLAAPSL